MTDYEDNATGADVLDRERVRQIYVMPLFDHRAWRALRNAGIAEFGDFEGKPHPSRLPGIGKVYAREIDLVLRKRGVKLVDDPERPGLVKLALAEETGAAR